MRVLVYGAGAVGQSVGGLLANAGHHVTMLLRPASADAIARAGLRITGLFGEYHVPADRLEVQTASRAVPGPGGNFDFILLTVKSYDTAAATADLAGLDDGRFVIVSMQNGHGNVEKLIERFGPDRVLCGRVITGFLIEQPGTVRITVHADAVTIGRFDGQASPPAETLAESLTSAGLPARASGQVQAELWAKILYNCALNPLGAILGVTYGELADRSASRAIMDRVIDEAYAVMAACGLPRLIASADAFRDAFYSRMVPPTAAHTPSMLQDIRAGKRTEIDALNGAVVALGRSAGVATPVNETLVGMVRFLEETASRGKR